MGRGIHLPKLDAVPAPSSACGRNIRLVSWEKEDDRADAGDLPDEDSRPVGLPGPGRPRRPVRSPAAPVVRRSLRAEASPCRVQAGIHCSLRHHSPLLQRAGHRTQGQGEGGGGSPSAPSGAPARADPIHRTSHRQAPQAGESLGLGQGALGDPFARRAGGASASGPVSAAPEEAAAGDAARPPGSGGSADGIAADLLWLAALVPSAVPPGGEWVRFPRRMAQGMARCPQPKLLLPRLQRREERQPDVFALGRPLAPSGAQRPGRPLWPACLAARRPFPLWTGCHPGGPRVRASDFLPLCPEEQRLVCLRHHRTARGPDHDIAKGGRPWCRSEPRPAGRGGGRPLRQPGGGARHPTSAPRQAPGASEGHPGRCGGGPGGMGQGRRQAHRGGAPGLPGEKTRLREDDKRYARKLSAFAYGKFYALLMARAAREGVEVLRVNPAFTSVIGKVKFMARYGLSPHAAAAVAIARRGLGFGERLRSGTARPLPARESRAARLERLAAHRPVGARQAGAPAL
ncbi:hypothetical protein E1B22_12530 (plasmid) [Thermaerobacter sp. FW80]|nr:hypothetical protein E1B22_12530 [Thermaerobacter sp. FW80]